MSNKLLKINGPINKPVRKYKPLLHLIAWLVYIGIESGPYFIGSTFQLVLFLLLPFVMYIGLFYFCTGYLFPLFYDKKKVLKFILVNLLVIVLYLMLVAWVTLMLYRYLDKATTISFKNTLMNIIYRGSMFVALAIAYWIAKRLIATQKRNNTLLENYYLQELREEELKQAIATAELAYIRAQINPHFLFNTLNFLYSSIYPLSGDIAKSVLMLSDIMRFVIENNEGGATDLSLEIRHIENYIKLNQLQSEYILYIDFEYTGILGNKKIIPFLLMNLVENAFKHGDLMDVKYPLKIRLEMLSESIRFCITNKISKVNLYEKSGIGMNNLEKCLELFYNNKFTLTTQNDGQYYSCTLDIELNMVSTNAFQLN
jgi:two-component system LytT family sensor kinase